MALVAVFKERSAGPDGEFIESERIVSASRYVTNPDQSSCEFSLLVSDEFKGKGLGSRLMEGIMAVARENGLSEMEGLGLQRQAPCRGPGLQSRQLHTLICSDIAVIAIVNRMTQKPMGMLDVSVSRINFGRQVVQHLLFDADKCQSSLPS